MNYYNLLFLKPYARVRNFLAAMAEAQLEENQGGVEVQIGLRAVLEPDYNDSGIPFSIFSLLLCLCMGYLASRLVL